MTSPPSSSSQVIEIARPSVRSLPTRERDGACSESGPADSVPCRDRAHPGVLGPRGAATASALAAASASLCLCHASERQPRRRRHSLSSSRRLAADARVQRQAGVRHLGRSTRQPPGVAHVCFLRMRSSASRCRSAPGGSRLRPISSVWLPLSARSLSSFRRPGRRVIALACSIVAAARLGTCASSCARVVAVQAAGPEPAVSFSLACSGLKKTRSATTALTGSSGRSAISCVPTSLCSTETIA